MSALRKCLSHPGSYLLALTLLGTLVSLDAMRSPERQLTAQGYIKLVGLYQSFGSPLLKGYVQCRFQPTCSRYSVEVVRNYGLGKGLILTATRLWRCRSNVPLGTQDVVP